MKRIALILSALAASAAGAPAFAQASNFTIVNATKGAFSAVAIRRVGTEAWRPLSADVPSRGRALVQFTNPDCAFDLRATVAGAGTVIWPGVNLCEVTVLTLNRTEQGAVWVDYD